MNESEYADIARRITQLMDEHGLPLLREQTLQATAYDRGVDRQDVSAAEEVLDLLVAIGQQIALEDASTLDAAIDRINNVAQSEVPIDSVFVTVPSTSAANQPHTLNLRSTLVDMSDARGHLVELISSVLED